MSPSNIFGRRQARRLSTSSSLLPRHSRMPSVFNIIRGSIYSAVLLWTVVCLAIAVHFQGILVASDLTHFVPFAIFVSSASLLVTVAFLASTLFKDRNPVSTRIELCGLGLLGVLWLALGVFLTISESAEADVECSSDSDSAASGFSSETYHAQYHVLEAFSLFNTILVWGFLLFLLFLALRQHRWGYNKVWLYPAPTYPWFSQGPTDASKYAQQSRLPAPVTAQASRRGASTQRAADKSRNPAPAQASFWVWVEKPKDPPQAHTRERPRDQSRRTNSGRR